MYRESSRASSSANETFFEAAAAAAVRNVPPNAIRTRRVARLSLCAVRVVSRARDEVGI